MKKGGIREDRKDLSWYCEEQESEEDRVELQMRRVHETYVTSENISSDDWRRHSSKTIYACSIINPSTTPRTYYDRPVPCSLGRRANLVS